MKKQIILIIITVFSLYAEQYPALYASFGTPLYEARSAFQKFSYLKNIKEKNLQYNNSVRSIITTGIELESHQIVDKTVRKKFLNSLRNLEKEYRFIIYLLNDHLSEAIEKNDVKLFSYIVNSNLEGIARGATLFQKTIDFYKKADINSPYLDMLIEEETNKRNMPTGDIQATESNIERTISALHVIGIYEGDYPNGTMHSYGFHPDGRVDIEVKDNPEVKSYILVLTSYEPVNWYISKAEKANIEKIILSNYHPGKVYGVNGIPIVRMKLGYTYDELSSEFINKIKEVTKFDTQSFQGSYKGKLFEIY